MEEFKEPEPHGPGDRPFAAPPDGRRLGHGADTTTGLAWRAA
jgi:hypothetical protein